MQTIMCRTILVLVILTIATLSPSLGRAQTFTADEVQKLKLLLRYVRVVEDHDNKGINGLAGPHVIIEGANVHIQSGTGTTGDGTSPIGLGNLIIGYNEAPPNTANPAEVRTGSHNLVIGPGHTFTSVGGLVAGQRNTISGPYASVSGGVSNKATNTGASVSGGEANTASGPVASISGGRDNQAVGENSSISGGLNNTASGMYAGVSGGSHNTASGERASVSGGARNKATNTGASVSGGEANTASGAVASISGGRDHQAVGENSSISGGLANIAKDVYASVSGGKANIASGAEASSSVDDPKWEALKPYVRVETAALNGMSGPHVIFEGVNVHIRNNAGSTVYPDGRGNLLIGYNEGGAGTSTRGGSHNLVIGPEHTFTSVGGLVAGKHNTISGPYASVSGGAHNKATNTSASVSGGEANTASGPVASISGGRDNKAVGENSSISGGLNNTASGMYAGVSGGKDNQAYANYSSISGGQANRTQPGAPYSSISGGHGGTGDTDTNVSHEWKAGWLSMRDRTTFVHILEILGQ